MNPTRIFHIGHTDLRIFLRHKSAYLWLFVMPLAFVYFMGFTNRGQDAPGNRRPLLLMHNDDTNFLGRIFSEELGAQGLRLLKTNESAEAAAEIFIPADFTQRTLAGRQTKIRLQKNQDSSQGDGAIIELRLARALVALNGHLLQAGSQTNPSEQLAEAGLRSALASTNPVTLEATFAGRKPVPVGFNFSLPAILIMYLMMNLLIFGGVSIAALRRNGVIRRLIATSTSRAELVQGKIYGLMLLGLVQVLFLLAVGKFLFHVNLGANVPAVILTLLVFAWVAGSLGVLVGSLTVAEDRVIGICVLASLVMAALGGCWWPLEIAPPIQKMLALCVPTGWALQALHRLISFGSGFSAVLVPLGVLALFGVASNILAVRLFRH